MEPFVHLHVHTEYSLLDGANRIPDLVSAAVEDGHEALAITDHGNLFGAVEFYKACRKAGIRPILGCEVYVAEKSRLEKHSRRDNPYTHLTLLARDEEGWRNLMDMASVAHLEGQHFRPRIDLEVLNARARGITCLSGCMSGPVNRKLARDDEDGALEMAGRLRDLFGEDHFYLEVMRNGMSEQDRLTEGMVRVQKRLGAPLIATNDIHYLRHEDCHAQDAMICLQTGAKLRDDDRWRMGTDTLFFRSREEMNRIFGDLPEALRNTLRVAEQVDLKIEMGRLRLPRFQPEDGSTPEQLFERLCREGFAACYPTPPPEARSRLEYEMKIITEMGFISYFLIVWDLIRFARQEGIPVGPGRGSAAGSIVAYVLGITRIDPLRYDLIFERFLNSSRISMPDIDIDFCKDRREEMIKYTRERYGEENVCQIITFGKLKAKNALRDMARVLEIPLSDADKAAKKVPDGPGVHLRKVLDDDPELSEFRNRSGENQQWFDLALKVEGLSRNAGVHAAGVIIADQPLREIIPLSQQNGVVTTQWDMNVCEAYGLLKMDFLGLRTLTILEQGRKLVEQATGEPLDLDALPLDDEKTYELLRAADTEGVFQLESPGMRRLLADLKPDCYEDLIAVLALFRPGPLGSGLHESYARRKHGKEKVSYPHPILEEILQETYGVLIYQEQIMRVAQRMAGFTLNEADTLRKAMGKKKRSLMEPFEKPFLEGAQEREVPAATSKEIWDMMVKFAEYGFNKSHSTGYAMVTYHTAWLKAHHPAQFYAATLTNEASDSDKLRILIEDARRHELRILPPCVNRSQAHFTVDGDTSVRFGLEAVKGVGTGAAESLVELREAREEKRFPNVEELLIDCCAATINRTTLEGLVKAGAFDVFGRARVDMLHDLPGLMSTSQHLAKDRAAGQGLLFDFGSSPAPPSTAGSAATAIESDDPEAAHRAPRPLSDEERKRTLALEKEALGLFLTRHPLDPYRELLGGISPWNSQNLRDASDGGGVAMAGIATLVEVRPTRKDPSRKFARFRVEDLTGAVDALAWPSTLEEYRDCMQEDFIGLFHGTVDQSGDTPTLLIERVQPLAEREAVRLEGSLEILLPPDPPLDALASALKANPGSSPVRFCYTNPAGETVVVRASSDWSVQLQTALIDEITTLLGPGSAQVVAKRKSSRPAQQPRWKTKAASAS